MDTTKQSLKVCSAGVAPQCIPINELGRFTSTLSIRKLWILVQGAKNCLYGLRELALSSDFSLNVFIQARAKERKVASY